MASPSPMLQGVVLLISFTGALFQGVNMPEVCIRVPQETILCEENVGLYRTDPSLSRIYCLQKLFWGYPITDNLTAEEVNYFETKSQRFIEDPRPRAGFKTRKEYRTLTTEERERVHAAFQALYKDGTIEKYAKLNSNAARVGHGGPAYLGFHRVLLAFFEEELRRVEPTSSLPYWDFTMDAEMDNPVNSIVWSDDYFGNANGEVISGPFRNWFTPKGPLQRHYGQSVYGKLTTKAEFRAMFRKCRLAAVSLPSTSDEDLETIFEYQLNGVRNWIGGTIANTLVSAYDPIYYMLLAYTDLQWERFRTNQRTRCNIQDDHDYPGTGSQYPEGHGPFDRMVGFKKFTNMRGLSSYWTRYWYGYTEPPSCPRCGSEQLWCNTRIGRCVSHSRRTDFNAGRFYNSTEIFEPTVDFFPNLNEYPAMPSPFNDGRTYATAKNDARNAVIERRSREGFSRTPSSVFRPPSSFPFSGGSPFLP